MMTILSLYLINQLICLQGAMPCCMFLEQLIVFQPIKQFRNPKVQHRVYKIPMFLIETVFCIMNI
jgi:hypothetical protein